MFSINTHIYKLSFANPAMTVTHKVSVTRKPISVVEKLQHFETFKKLSIHLNIDLTCFF